MLRVAIVTDTPGWHGAQLRRAFRARGIEARYVHPARCRVDLDAHAGLVIEGFRRALPDGVFVRGIPGGTLEQITLRLDALHALGDAGIPVYNNAGAIERSVDKARTSLLLRAAGIPTPATWVTEDPVEARRIVLRETARGGELVAKPLFGSMGRGLARLAAGADVPAAETCGGVWYLQRYIAAGSEGYRDWRLLVAGRRVVAGMIRRGRGWINNVAQGAHCEPAPADPELARLTIDAVDAVGMDYAGVDLMREPSGAAVVIEVNSIPAWKGLQGVTDFNIAERLVDDFVERRLGRRLEAAC